MGEIVDLIVKVAERCNLKCGYCYMYEHEDRSWLTRPKRMSFEVLDRLLERVNEYCDRRPGHRMRLTFHGGEPTLIGAPRMAEMARRVRASLGDRLGGLTMQTNGTLLDDDWIAVLREHRIHVGVSIDGPAEIHDRARPRHSGAGSHADTVRGVRLLRDAGLDPGLLCVVNPGLDGLTVYEHLRSLGTRRIFFLLPDITHDNKARWYGDRGPTPVADYLIPVFDRWLEEDDPDLEVRPFRNLITMMLGGEVLDDAFGNPLESYLIVETDGGIHALDALRVCADGIADSGLNLRVNGFDDLALGMPFVHRVVHEGIPLCDTCRRCPEAAVCGGGHLPHRYARGSGFDNPSVWCADVLALLDHIRTRLLDYAERADRAIEQIRARN